MVKGFWRARGGSPPSREIDARSELRAAVAALGTERLTALAARLEDDPHVKVTVGSWLPRCPMVLAGFDFANARPDASELPFAFAWDRFAMPERGRLRSALPWFAATVASQPDVQFLLRQTNAELARRASRHGLRHPLQEARGPSIRTGGMTP